MPLNLGTPKEMITIGAKPIIEHVIDFLKTGGIENVLVIVNRKKTAILDYLGSGEDKGVHIFYEIQDKPSGTAHAAYLGKNFVNKESFVVVHGDNYFRSNSLIKRTIRFHNEKEADATLVLRKVKDTRGRGIVKLGAENQILGIVEKPTPEEARPWKIGDHYLGICGLLILEPLVFDFIEQTSLGRNGETWLTDSIELMRKKDRKVYGVLSMEMIRDIGTPESLREARASIREPSKRRQHVEFKSQV